MLLPPRLMLLPFVLFMVLADVIANFVVMWWQMLLPSGRCYGHYRVDDGTVADVITTGQIVSSLKYLFCYGENLTLHYGKQNEKPTYTKNFQLQVKLQKRVII